MPRAAPTRTRLRSGRRRAGYQTRPTGTRIRRRNRRSARAPRERRDRRSAGGGAGTHARRPVLSTSGPRAERQSPRGPRRGRRTRPRHRRPRRDDDRPRRRARQLLPDTRSPPLPDGAPHARRTSSLTPVVPRPPRRTKQAMLAFAMPAELTRDHVLQVAALATLHLDPSETDLFERQLGVILAYAD